MYTCTQSKFPPAACVHVIMIYDMSQLRPFLARSRTHSIIFRYAIYVPRSGRVRHIITDGVVWPSHLYTFDFYSVTLSRRSCTISIICTRLDLLGFMQELAVELGARQLVPIYVPVIETSHRLSLYKSTCILLWIPKLVSVFIQSPVLPK
jgi:hypothetical protein